MPNCKPRTKKVEQWIAASIQTEAETETESKVQSEPESELKYADVTYLGQIV